MNLNLGKWKTLKEMTSQEEKTLLKVVYLNRVITSPRKLAQSYGIHLLEKLKKIKMNLPNSSILGETVFKRLVQRVQKDFELKTISIPETYK